MLCKHTDKPLDDFSLARYEPPFLPDNCTTAERAAIVDFGASLVAQMQPMLKAKQDTVC